jgi:hypothetical protein
LWKSTKAYLEVSDHPNRVIYDTLVTETGIEEFAHTEGLMHEGLCTHGLSVASMIAWHLDEAKTKNKYPWDPNQVVELKLFGHSLGASSATIAGHVLAKVARGTLDPGDAMEAAVAEVSSPTPPDPTTYRLEDDELEELAQRVASKAEHIPREQYTDRGLELMDLHPMYIEGIIDRQNKELGIKRYNPGVLGFHRQLPYELPSVDHNKTALPLFMDPKNLSAVAATTLQSTAEPILLSGEVAQFNVSVQVVSCPMYARGNGPLSLDSSAMPQNLTCRAYTSAVCRRGWASCAS